MIEINVSLAKNFDNTDASAARQMIEQENATRATQNPPLDPLEGETPKAIKLAVESILRANLESVWGIWRARATDKDIQSANLRTKWANLSDDQRTRVMAIFDEQS